jgi:DNA-binding transcriptional regulator YbjK
VIFRRARFQDVISRQLDLFEADNRGDIAETRERLAVYNRADREDAEELYGDYVLHVDAVKEILEDLRDTYARTLEEGVDEQYEREFNRAVAKRYPPFALIEFEEG